MQTANDDSGKQNQSPIGAPVKGPGKEGEPVLDSGEPVRDASAEIELPQEVKEAGVEHISGTIELPPDIKKLGVTSVGQSQIPVQTAALPVVALPVSDQKVVAGLHASVTSALLWLATWCIRKLKKAHVVLKSAGGKIIRVRS